MNIPTILVVGATGQLGSAVVARLSGLGACRIRALVRQGSAHDHLRLPNVELVAGDLRSLDSLKMACEGVSSVIATATVVFPRGSYSFAADEESGYRNLIRACIEADVARVVYVSLAIPFSQRYRSASATYRSKALVERLLRESPLHHSIVRCAPFMDDYFALIGSGIPLLGEPAATLDRATGLTKAFRRLAGRSIDSWGVALVPGSPDNRHAFVAVRDVARILVDAAYARQPRQILEVGGPESLSWHSVCVLYERLLQRPVRAVSMPLPALRMLAWLCRPFSEAIANQLAILWILGENETGHIADASLSSRMTVSASHYLAGKAAAGQR